MCVSRCLTGRMGGGVGRGTPSLHMEGWMKRARTFTGDVLMHEGKKRHDSHASQQTFLNSVPAVCYHLPGLLVLFKKAIFPRREMGS